jgi:hypothetical protein
MIKEAYGNESQYQGSGRPPEPEVLMEQIESKNCQNENGCFHSIHQTPLKQRGFTITHRHRELQLAKIPAR